MNNGIVDKPKKQKRKMEQDEMIRTNLQNVIKLMNRRMKESI